MARLMSSIALSALLTGIITAQSLQSCGTAQYDPTQYTCFGNATLCPIVNGDKYLACGSACFSTTQYTCINATSGFLCPVINGTRTVGCGGTQCYSLNGEYTCNSGKLNQIPAGCIGNFGSNPICDDNACVFYGGHPCCPGLLNVAGRCRDPCDLSPNSPNCHN
ncbi:carbohydrate binding-domain-containing protein, partial [Mycena rebaudengoi]